MPAVGVTDTKIRFQLGERELTLDYRKVPFVAWAELKRATNFTQRTLVQALEDLDVEAIAALIWLERKQRERKLSYMEVVADLQADESDGDEQVDFEITDLIIRGRSLMGRRAGFGDDAKKPVAEIEDPTKGS